MFKLRIALAALATAVACGDPAPDQEARSLDVPPRELEIARVEEPSVVREARPAVRPDTTVPDSESTLPSPAPAPETAPADESSPAAKARPLPAPPPSPGAQRADESETPDSTSAPAAGRDVESPDTAGYREYDAEDTASAPAAPPPIGPSPADAPPPVAPPATAPAPAGAPAGGGVLAVGTVIHATLVDSIHSRHDVSGKEVQARVMQAVTGSGGEVLIPAGAPVGLTVTQVKSGRGDRQGVLEIRTDSILIGGRPRKLQATIRSVPRELRGRGVTGDEAAKVGVGAAGGAVLGRVITGDTEGAIIGGVVGAAGGAVVASETAAKDVVVKARTPVELVLTAPLPTN